MPKTHHLKTWPIYFKAVQDGRKTFEIRDNTDRDFQEDDIVVLEEWNPLFNEYTSGKISRRITYVTNFQQMAGYVVFGLSPR